MSVLWSRSNAKKWVFIVHYHISLQCIVIRCVVTVDYGHFSSSHNSRIVSSKQNVYMSTMNYRFVVCILFWQIQNRYKEMDVIRSLFARYNACNLHRDYCTHDYGGWWRLSMVVTIERCWVERLSCKGCRI